MMVGDVSILIALILSPISAIISVNSDFQIFQFSRNETLHFPGKRLDGYVFQEFSTKRQVIHCAYECLRSNHCMSFNYAHLSLICQLNNGNHELYRESLIDDEAGTVTGYYHRDAFHLDMEGLGPCALDPCQNGGRCLDTVNWRMERTFFCVCTDDWTGDDCDVKIPRIDWGDWGDWGTCSVTCETGWTTRRRQCQDMVMGEVFPSTECFGRDVEYRSCTLQECPRWDPWEAWGDCSTKDTCGPGVKQRYRTCAGGGNPGVDRYCLGYSNNTSPCQGIDCWGMVLVQNSSVHGQGRVEMVDSDRKRMIICSDNIWLSIGENIVCRQIGFEGAGEETHTKFGWSELQENTPSYHLNCTGEERTIQQCRREKVTDCSHLAEMRCKVRGSWSLWTAWGVCSVTCENGTRTRARYCNHPSPNFGGTPCPGPSVQYKPCTLPMCPVDGVWNLWASWSECSQTCGYGSRNRSRTCDGPFYGGLGCPGDTSKMETCNAFSCPVDGVWEPWLSWQDCDTTCGGGSKLRVRICEGPFFGGEECPGLDNNTSECNMHECPINGVWRAWSGWSECSTSCENGTMYRTRTCEGPFFGGLNCFGDRAENEECFLKWCPVDGVWYPWQPWQDCDVTCGGGSRVRIRECDGPFFAGTDCQGQVEDTTECNTHECPINGVWRSWSGWSECSTSCENGTMYRNRTCDGPFFGGLNCFGEQGEAEECFLKWCPVDGVWENWGVWDVCTVTCGGGNQSRSRDCIGPFHNGSECEGQTEDQRQCSVQPCPVDGIFSDWSGWGECNVTCGGGIQLRNRSCDGPYHGGGDCVGPYNNSQDCNAQECPINGVWQEWMDWDPCTVTCGGGSKVRTRDCDGPFYGGADCPGSPTDSSNCGTDLCTIPGDWFGWTMWSLCTVTCGGGTRYRNRTCDLDSYGELTTECEGPDEETKNCHTFDCLPLAVHCADWADRGLNQSCTADILPDSEDSLIDPVQVECDFDSEPGKAITVIHHDHENRTRVKGYEGAGDYQAYLNYDTGWAGAVKVVDASAECAQFMRWECMAANIHNVYNPGMPTTYWKNRTQQVTNYFGGATPESGNCACGETSSCFTMSLPCNCDENDQTWRFDEGYVTYKPELPIHSFYAGDTGGGTEDGYHVLGPLLCW